MHAIFLILVALIGQLGYSRSSIVPCEVPLIEKPESSIEETATNIRGLLEAIPAFLERMERTKCFDAVEFKRMLSSTYPHTFLPVLDKLFLNSAALNGSMERSFHHLQMAFGAEFDKNPFPNSLNSLLETLKEIIRKLFKEQQIATESYVESDDFALDAMVLFLNCGLICTTKDFAMQLANAENFEAPVIRNFYLKIHQAVVLDFLDDKCLQNRFYPLLDNINASENNCIHLCSREFTPFMKNKLITFEDSFFCNIWSEEIFADQMRGKDLCDLKESYKEFWENRENTPLRVRTLVKPSEYTHKDPIIVERGLHCFGSPSECDFDIPTTIDLSQVKFVVIEFNSDIAWTDSALLRNLSSRINEDYKIFVLVEGDIAAKVIDYFYKYQLKFGAILNLHFNFKFKNPEFILDRVQYDLQMKFLKIDCPLSLLVPFWRFPSLEWLYLRVEDEDLMSLQSIALFPELKRLNIILSSKVSFTLADLLAQLNDCSENLLFISLIIPGNSVSAFASGIVEYGRYFILEVVCQLDIYHDLMKNLNDLKPNLSISIIDGKRKLKDMYPNIDFIENYFESLRFTRTKAIFPSASNE